MPIPCDLLGIALDWLEHEDLEWDEEPQRSLRREEEIALLRKATTENAAIDENQ